MYCGKLLNRKLKSMQQVQQTVLNKCPHGFPAGTCPICSGHGGASKDKNKPRVPGEMSYNECMAAWIKIQAAKEARIQEKIDRITQAQEQLKLNRLMAGLVEKTVKFQQFIDKTLQNFPVAIKNVINNSINITIQTVIKVVQVVVNISLNIANFISSTSEKLASVFGEVKNFIASQIEKKIKKPIKILLSFFAESDEEDGEDREKIKKLLKSTILKIKGKKKEDKRHAPN